MSVVVVEPGRLRQELQDDGRWKLLRPFVLRIDGEDFVCPEGLVHDGSSWPRCLPGPRQSRIMAAGVVHDCAFQLGTFGAEGRTIGFWEANRLWYKVSLSGLKSGARASKFWARVGRAGLAAAAYPTWLRYRREDGRASPATA